MNTCYRAPRWFTSSILIGLMAVLLMRPALPSPTHAQEGEEPPAPPAIDLSEARPLPLPERGPELSVASEPGVMIGFDPATGEETELSPLAGSLSALVGTAMPAAIADAEAAQAAGLLPAAPEAAATPDSFTNLQWVANPQAWPESAHVKIFVRFGQNWFGCSGALINARYVLTAGHCIHDRALGGWASSAIVIPAYANGSEPFGRANVTYFSSSTGWTDRQDVNWDMAYLRLDRPVGALTGWLGYGYNTNDYFFRLTVFANPGYPAEGPYNGAFMYSWRGTYDWTQGNILYHGRRSYGGQSGSVSYDTIHSRAYGVLSHGLEPSGATGSTRINEWLFTNISQTIGQNTPAQPNLVPLNVIASQAGLTAGDQVGASVLVYNDARTAWSGRPITIRLYLSRNETISAQDVLLNTSSIVPTIEPGGRLRINLPPATIPLHAEGGTAWLGAIIDVADSNLGDNHTQAWDAARIGVSAFVPAAPRTISASDATSTEYITITWGAVYGSVDYEVQRRRLSTDPWVVVGRTSGQHYRDLSAVIGLTYTYRVRARAANGLFGSYSASDGGSRSRHRIYLPLLIRR